MHLDFENIATLIFSIKSKTISNFGNLMLKL